MRHLFLSATLLKSDPDISGSDFSRTILAAFFLLTVFFAFPFGAYAAEWKGLVPQCGGTPAPVLDTATGATTRTYTPCSTCDFALLVKTALDFVVKNIALAGVALMLMVGGFQMITGAIGGSANAHQKGLATIKNAFIGLAIVLFAWLAVDTVIKFIAQQSLTSGTAAELFKKGAVEPPPPGFEELVGPQYGFWNQIECTSIYPIDVVTKPPPPPSKIPPPGSPPSAGGGASCTQVQTGSCSVSSLQSTFGPAAVAASTICQAESAGVDSAESRRDILPRSGNRPFSVGLFQINLTANTFTCGGQTLNCPNAFQGRNRDAIIIDEDLYNRCRQAPKNAFCNVQKAKALYDNRGGRWTDWVNTARNCNLPI